MILVCDECRRFYESDAEGHYFGEPNLCCEACAWKVSNDGEPQPEHTCDKRFDRDVKSLLVFFECCLVDNYGRIDNKKINKIDVEIGRALAKDGYIEFGRIQFSRISNSYPCMTHWVRFTDRTWIITHYLRKERSDRMIASKPRYDDERAIN